MKKIYLFIIAIIIFADQIVKYTIETSLSFAYIKNTGSAYSFGSSYPLIIIVLNIIILSILLVILLKKRQVLSDFCNTCLSIAIAGGISNLIDRIFRGYVVDYIDINKIISFPIFNLADICIVIAGIVLCMGILKEGVK